MRTLKDYFPMIRERKEVLEEIREKAELSDILLALRMKAPC